MTRLPGDPGPIGWLRFAAGFRLPAANVHWVRHELTDAGWRWRTVVRHLVIIVPVCAILVVLLEIFLPTPAWVSAMMVALILPAACSASSSTPTTSGRPGCASTACPCPPTATWAGPLTERVRRRGPAGARAS